MAFLTICLGLDMDDCTEVDYLQVFKEIVNELSKMDQESVDSLMYRSKREHVGRYRAKITLRNTSYYRKERWFSTAFYLMLALLKFDSHIKKSNDPKKKVGKDIMTADKFVSIHCDHFKDNVKFFNEIVLVLMHVFGGVTHLPIVFESEEFRKFVSNHSHAKTKYNPVSNKKIGTAPNCADLLEMSAKSAFFCDIAILSGSYDKKNPLCDYKKVLAEYENFSHGQLSKAHLMLYKNMATGKLPILCVHMGLDGLNYLYQGAIYAPDNRKDRTENAEQLGPLHIKMHKEDLMVWDFDKEMKENYALLSKMQQGCKKNTGFGCNPLRFENHTMEIEEVEEDEIVPEQACNNALKTLVESQQKLSTVLQQVLQDVYPGTENFEKRFELETQCKHVTKDVDKVLRNLPEWVKPEEIDENGKKRSVIPWSCPSKEEEDDITYMDFPNFVNGPLPASPTKKGRVGFNVKDEGDDKSVDSPSPDSTKKNRKKFEKKSTPPAKKRKRRGEHNE